METNRNVSPQKYGRDFLLQLRMHPLSLHKPNIGKFEIVKDKLYFHQIGHGSNSPSMNSSDSGYFFDSLHGPLKLEPDAVFHLHRSFQDTFPWRYSCSNAVQKGSAAHLGLPSLKNVPFFLQDYIGPMRMHAFPSMEDYKFDTSIDEVFSTTEKTSSLVPWSKRCSIFDEIWNTSCQHMHSNSKASCENMKIEKKVLPIIDPTNGKNILDSISKSSSVLDDNIFSIQKNEVIENNVVISEMGDNFCGNEKKVNFHEVGANGCGDVTPNLKCTEEISKSSHSSESLIGTMKISEANDSSRVKDMEQCIADDRSLTPNSSEESNEGIYKTAESDKLNVKEKKSLSSEANSSKEKYHSPPMEENVLQFEDQLKVNLMLLSEKLHFLKQEQQKMAIVQSFLRFKKHQLDESFRNLDDKKIEIANWEYDLLTKAKRLHEKECWLETKKLALKNKEEKLEYREKALNQKEYGAKLEKSCKGEIADIKNKNNNIEHIPHFQKVTDFNAAIDVDTNEPCSKKIM